MSKKNVNYKSVNDDEKPQKAIDGISSGNVVKKVTIKCKNAEQKSHCHQNSSNSHCQKSHCRIVKNKSGSHSDACTCTYDQGKRHHSGYKNRQKRKQNQRHQNAKHTTCRPYQKRRKARFVLLP